MANHWLRTRVQVLRAPPFTIFLPRARLVDEDRNLVVQRLCSAPSSRAYRPFRGRGRGGGSRLGPSPVGPESFHLGGRAPLPLGPQLGPSQTRGPPPQTLPGPSGPLSH